MDQIKEIIKILDDILGIIDLSNRGLFKDDPMTAIANRIFLVKEILSKWKTKT